MKSAKPSVIWLTGLSAAGKTTIALKLLELFKAIHIIPELLDGDEIRKLTGEYGFDKASRIRHNLKVGQMASTLEKEGKIVVVAMISPYSETRKQVRNMCAHFIEVYVSTNLERCIRRDPKGLYKKALAGEIQHFTGISSPYEIPLNAEIVLDTEFLTVEESARLIYDFYLNKIIN
ncbi:MAG: adenylyl-sulfate kinase [Chitinophagaceae bacterium]